MADRRNGRTRRERRNADDLKARRLQPCMRCGQDIDYSLEYGDPSGNAFNAGHIKSWIGHPELREDPANLQQEHENCNKAAQKTDGGSLNIGTTSTDW